MDKNMTFRPGIAGYHKEDLKGMAEQLGLRRLSKLRKAELIDLIEMQFLNPEVMFYHAATLTDREIALLEKGLNGSAPVRKRDLNVLFRLNELDLVIVEKGEFLVPCDVAEVLQKIRTPEFEAYRTRASWVWMCLCFAEHFYGYAPLETMQEMISCKKSCRMTDQELIDIFHHFPENGLRSFLVGDIFLEEEYAEDMQALLMLRASQEGKEYYIPSAAEVTEFYETGMLLSDKPYQDLIRFLERELRLKKEEISEIMFPLWNMLSSDCDPHDTMQWFWDQLVFESDQQVEKIMKLYMAAANGTRMLANRGHKPQEMRYRNQSDPDRPPVIQAGSTHAAQMLSQIAPEIQEMGFTLDLESNAKRVPVAEFPSGITGQATVSEKKIYPNDPCPCGSGKKFKKCCGKR